MITRPPSRLLSWHLNSCGDFILDSLESGMAFMPNCCCIYLKNLLPCLGNDTECRMKDFGHRVVNSGKALERKLKRPGSRSGDREERRKRGWWRRGAWAGFPGEEREVGCKVSSYHHHQLETCVFILS